MSRLRKSISLSPSPREISSINFFYLLFYFPFLLFPVLNQRETEFNDAKSFLGFSRENLGRVDEGFETENLTPIEL